MRAPVGHKEILKKEDGSFSNHTSVFFFVKLSSETSSSQPVFFGVRYDDPDESPTVKLEVLSPEIFMCLSDYIISVNFSLVQLEI